MTVTYESVGTVASAGGTSLAPGSAVFSGTGIPSGSGDGFLAVIFWGNADDLPVQYDAGIWDFVGDAEGGAGAWLADSGIRHVSAYWASGDITGTTQTFVNGGANDTGNLILGYIIRCTKTLPYWAPPQTAEASDNISGSAFSATFNTDPGAAVGDLAVTGIVANTDAVNPAGLTLTWPGTTGTATLVVTTPSAAGNDSRVVVRRRTIDTGPSSGVPGITSTTDFVGAALLIRLRDTNTPPIDAPVAVTGGDATVDPWVEFPLNGAASEYTGTPAVEWEHISGGTGTVVIANPAALVTTAHVDPTTWADEDYVFRLTISDAGGTDTADVTKTVLRSSVTVSVGGVDRPARLTME